MLSTGDAASALPALLPVVRQKSSEFWAWHLLAETLEPTDPAAALACLYRASACGSEEKFLGKVRLKLARLLATIHPGEARWQLGKAQATYAAEGWSLKSEALLLAGQLASHPAAPAEAARREWLALAEQTTYGDLPWQPVVLHYISPDTPEKPAMARLPPAGAAVRPVSVPLRKQRWLQKLPLGTPLQMRSETVAGRLCVRQLQAREKAGDIKQYVLAAERSTAVPDARICRAFAGALQLHKAGFGFADNIFLSAALISQRGWRAGDAVSGRAVMQHNKKKNKDEWNAVQVD